MVLIPIKCPHCGSEDVGKHGYNKKGDPRYICKMEIA